MKKYLTIVLVAAVAFFIIGVAKDIVIKTSVEKGVEAVTGLKLKIGAFKVGVLRPVVDIKNLKLYNPTNFHDRIMADMPEIYVNYDLPAILGGKIHLPEVRLNLKEFIVVKNAKGELNLDALKSVQAEKEGKAPSKKAVGKAPDILIDSLKLTVEKVIYKDYSSPGEPVVKEYNLNLDETYTNVDNPYKLVNLIVVRVMMNTSISGLTNFDLGGLEGTLGESLSSAHSVVAAGEEQVERAAQTAVDAVKEIFKNPFGSKK